MLVKSTPSPRGIVLIFTIPPRGLNNFIHLHVKIRQGEGRESGNSYKVQQRQNVGRGEEIYRQGVALLFRSAENNGNNNSLQLKKVLLGIFASFLLLYEDRGAQE